MSWKDFFVREPEPRWSVGGLTDLSAEEALLVMASHFEQMGLVEIEHDSDGGEPHTDRVEDLSGGASVDGLDALVEYDCGESQRGVFFSRFFGGR